MGAGRPIRPSSGALPEHAEGKGRQVNERLFDGASGSWPSRFQLQRQKWLQMSPDDFRGDWSEVAAVETPWVVGRSHPDGSLLNPVSSGWKRAQWPTVAVFRFRGRVGQRGTVDGDSGNVGYLHEITGARYDWLHQRAGAVRAVSCRPKSAASREAPVRFRRAEFNQRSADIGRHPVQPERHGWREIDPDSGRPHDQERRRKRGRPETQGANCSAAVKQARSGHGESLLTL